nr:hypothetical protein [Bacteroidaceae bacterium]
IISQTSDDLRNCKEALTNAALEADGSDNITIALMEIVTTPLEITGEVRFPKKYKESHWLSGKYILIFVFVLALLVSLGVSRCKFCGSPQPQDSLQDSALSKDTVSKAVVAKDSISVKEVEKDTTIVREQLHGWSSQTFMEEATKTSDESANPPLDDNDPEAELTRSNSAGPLKVEKRYNNILKKQQ